MQRPLLPLCIAALASVGLAQEAYWVPGTGGLRQMSVCGHVLQTVAGGSNPAIAPDGKVWSISGATLTVLNPNGTFFTTVTPTVPGFSPYDVTFDKAGHAWVTSSSGLNSVEEFDAAGNPVANYTLLADQARGITVDASGNKWIAHRLGPPGSISRIDAVTKAITNHPLPSTSRILPLLAMPDSRGIVNPSHIWVIGDNRGAGEVVEFDANGNHLNTYVTTAGARLNSLAVDVDATGVTQNVWTCDYSTGVVYKVNAANGTFAQYTLSSGVFDVAIDGFGNVWATLARPASGIGEVQRLDPATGAVEVIAAIGASDRVATQWHHAIVVDQLGDLDNDGVPNLFDASGGSSPSDGCSTTSCSLSIEGATKIGGPSALRIQGATGMPIGLGFATGVVSPGLSLPGIKCALQLDPVKMAPVTVAVTGSVTVPLMIPNDPGIVGSVFYIQGVQASTSPSFTNVTCMLFY